MTSLGHDSKMLFIEIVGAVTGLASVWLLTKQNSWGWPLGLVYIVFSMVLFFQARLYGEVLAHAVFFALSIYGWLNWKRLNASEQANSGPSYLTQTQRLSYFALVSLLSVSAGRLFATYSNNPLPYLDGLVMVLSFAGMWFSANKKIENWLLWVVVNLVSIGIYLNQGLYIYVLLYCLFLAQAFNGFFVWKLSYARNRKSP